MNHALEVYYEQNLIFYHEGKWLYPLLEFAEFLKTHEYLPSELLVRDKIIGRAAALVLVHLGIRSIKAGMLSTLGEEILKMFKVEYSFELHVERIACATEDLLINETDPQIAFELIKKRANRQVTNG